MTTNINAVIEAQEHALGEAAADAPWPDAVDGDELLKSLCGWFAGYLGLHAGVADYLAVFTLVTHALDAFNVAPYAAIVSPAPECGKTRLLELLELVVRRGWLTAVVTGPVLFRKIERDEPCLLLDESEVVRGDGEGADIVRAILHAGYRRGAVVERCVGKNFALVSFQVFGPKVFAAIGELPSTLLSRCVVIRMTRAPAGHVKKFRRKAVEARALELQRQARRWARDHVDDLRSLTVETPAFLSDRMAEVWEPLFAVAHVAVGDWPTRLHRAAEILTGGRAESRGEELLRDCRVVFDACGVDRIASVDLALELNELEGQPWADYNGGKGIRPNQVAKLLKTFDIRPPRGSLRIGEQVVKGYKREQFAGAWASYLALPPPQTVTRLQASDDGPYSRNRLDDVTGHVTAPEPEIVAPDGHCNHVTAPAGGSTSRHCPRGHAMQHALGVPLDHGWVCQVCYPDAAAALGIA